jgi:hypothetical protein
MPLSPGICVMLPSRSLPDTRIPTWLGLSGKGPYTCALYHSSYPALQATYAPRLVGHSSRLHAGANTRYIRRDLGPY